MENKAYILANGEDQDIKFKIYGVYESEDDAIKAKEHLRQQFQFTKMNKKLQIIEIGVNPYLDLASVAIMEFEVSFDKATMNPIMPNYPEYIHVDHQIDPKKYPNAPHTYRMINTIALDQVILQYNYKDKSDDSTHFLTATCKIIIDDLKSKHEIFMAGRNLILKDLENKKVNSFFSMIDKISIELDPSYNFLTNKIDLLKIYVDDILEDYSRILIDIFKKLLTNYREKLLSVLGDYTDEYEKIEKEDYINRKEILSQIKSQCELKLLEFNWYKENPSLNNGLKEFMINGNNIFG